MRRRILVVLLAAVLALVVGACGAEVRKSGGGDEGGDTGGGGQKGPIRLAVVPIAVGFNYWETVHNGAKCAAQKAEGDVNIQWDGVTAETDVNGQVNLLQNFITQGVDGLVYAPANDKVLADVSQQALDQGLAVVNFDAGTTPQPEEVPVFATDSAAAGKEAGGFLADELGEKGGKVAILEHAPGTETSDQRVDGFVEGLKTNPNLRVVAQQSSKSDYNTALSVADNILTANPDLDAIYATNEPGALGAAEAVRKANKAGDIVIVGWDAAEDEIKAVQDGVINALVVQDPFRMGYDGVNAAVNMIQEGTDVNSEDTGVTLVTKKNLNTSKVQAILNPTCKNPPH